VKANNRDGILSRKIRFIPCSKRDVGARTRAEKEKHQYQITLGLIIAWTGVIILHGTISDSSKSLRQYYLDFPRSLKIMSQYDTFHIAVIMLLPKTKMFVHFSITSSTVFKIRSHGKRLSRESLCTGKI